MLAPLSHAHILPLMCARRLSGSALEVREVPSYQPQATNLDDDDAMLTAVCRSLSADVFVSTFYTRLSVNSTIPQLLLVHDFTPEVLKWDLSDHQVVAVHSCMCWWPHACTRVSVLVAA